MNKFQKLLTQYANRLVQCDYRACHDLGEQLEKRDGIAVAALIAIARAGGDAEAWAARNALTLIGETW